ncbi:MAG: hypothetical protein V1754_04100 [Pseudomonadota bacterium]
MKTRISAVVVFAMLVLGGVGCSSSSSPGKEDSGTQQKRDDSGNIPDNDSTTPSGAVIAGHEAIASFGDIPSSYFQKIRDDYKFFYGHTSHGNQIMVGLRALAEENADYNLPTFEEVSEDLGGVGDTAWADTTRNYLNSGNSYNVAIWSWCGGVSEHTSAGIQTYLNTMSQLETEYPWVVFVYMTGHTDGTGASGTLRTRNAQIREYCQNNNKVLFDFEDIESWDPGGTYYPDTDDACGWCEDWCSKASSCPSCSEECDHSHCFNCYQKGKAFWWMMARLAGWGGK